MKFHPKKLLSLLMAGLMLFSASACAQTDDTPKDTSATEAMTEADTDNKPDIKFKDYDCEFVITGVDDVERFDENEVSLQTSAGTLVITGDNLHIGKLSLDGGELHVDGHIEGINYEEPVQPRRGMFSRLFA